MPTGREAAGKRQAPARLPLREHRLRARVSLEEIMGRTKLSRRFLEAIEEGRYGDLPGGVFTLSYIRQYADAIGYDAELILEHWRKTSAGAEEPAVEARRTQTPRWIRFFQSV